MKLKNVIFSSALVFIFLTSKFFASLATMGVDYQEPYKLDEQFFNHKGEKENFMQDSLAVFAKTLTSRKFPSEEQKKKWVTESNHPEVSEQPVITWVGHSTFLIQVGGINILTDPIYGHLSAVLYRRILPEGIPFEKLPKIDVILISHNHNDHMDKRTLLKIKKANPAVAVLVPENNGSWFEKRGFESVGQCSWRGSVDFSSGDERMIKFTCLPAHHWSICGLNKNTALWCSWMITYQDKNIYFAGDTAYKSHFRLISEMFPSIDVALLPIGPCEPSKNLKEHHMNAKEAVSAFMDLGAQHFVPMHWGTFGLGPDFFDDPIKLLQKTWQERSDELQNNSLHLLKAGQQFSF